MERGLQEKLYRGWDFALVLVPNEREPRERIFTLGVPSSALEVAVLSSARLGPPSAGLSARVAALALHLLGHLWGLEHAPTGPMAPPEGAQLPGPAPFSPQERAAISSRLAEAADARLEEQPRSRLGSWLSFAWRTFREDPRGILADIWACAPWQMPLRMARLTAATAVSLVFLLLGSDAWVVGVNAPARHLGGGAALSVLAATLFVFLGQNLGSLARGAGRREQLTRTHLVLFFTLLLGMGALWCVLFGVSLLATSLVPRAVVSAWVGGSPGAAGLARHAAFMASLGVLAGALGGNLEDEGAIKAELFYDEET